jgi:PhnB protein
MPTTLIQPYLFFAGRCEEAIDLYARVIGAEILGIMYYRDNPAPQADTNLPPGFEDKVMHATLKVGGSTLMVSDGCETQGSFSGFQLSIAMENKEKARLAFEGLAEGGSVQLPLSETFWSPCFGMLRDRFGVNWMITVQETPSSK